MSVSPPRPKGPPLNALRTFESAARLRSFSRAAEELCVTPGAVAQQIKGLEDWLGVALFERQAKGVKPTALATDTIGDFTRAFDDLARAVQKMKAGSNARVIHIATLPSIAQLWLSGRLPAIRQAFPDVTISVTAVETIPNLTRDAFDLGIFFSAEQESETLRRVEQDRLSLVCAPEIAARIETVDDLLHENLISDLTWADDWSIWRPQSGVSPKGPTYSLYSLAIQEVINGAGVMIGHLPLVKPLLDSGALQEPLKDQVANGLYLSLILPLAFSDDVVLTGICERLAGGVYGI